ncbi:MAG: Formylmethanofuran dehydrogenase subunit A [Methanoculleus marisnigri]|uniref:Formylmethanofuran dehydrogenase subunit A n=1 Tax=Methanoculleus marisnigri TaxID=2198 RepID=A0A101IRL7_9EURY|nr:MAG: Formylmethanofuran dehydrogenase subunit A [Methanoculleus marisnigri]
MAEFLIKNGFVFDPILGIKGDVADVAIKDGKIVETTALSSPKVIDATGKTVMAGGVDIHAHVAGPKVNIGRNFRPEDKLFNCTAGHGIERMQGGLTTGSYSSTSRTTRSRTPPRTSPGSCEPRRATRSRLSTPAAPKPGDGA